MCAGNMYLEYENKKKNAEKLNEKCISIQWYYTVDSYGKMKNWLDLNGKKKKKSSVFQYLWNGKSCLFYTKKGKKGEKKRATK